MRTGLGGRGKQFPSVFIVVIVTFGIANRDNDVRVTASLVQEINGLRQDDWDEAMHTPAIISSILSNAVVYAIESLKGILIALLRSLIRLR